MLRMLCRTMIWQGAEDKSVPVSHAQWWSRKIPGAKLTVLEGEGHVTVLLRFSKVILDAALHWRPQDTAAAEAGAGGAVEGAAGTAGTAAAAAEAAAAGDVASAHKSHAQHHNRVSHAKQQVMHGGGGGSNKRQHRK